MRPLSLSALSLSSFIAFSTINIVGAAEAMTDNAKAPEPSALEIQRAAREARYRDLLKQLRSKAGPETKTKEEPLYQSLPQAFGLALRGCSTDGYIYRMPYTLAVNGQDLRTLFDRSTRPASDAILGIKGTQRYMQSIADFMDQVYTAMDKFPGALIDNTASAAINSPAFTGSMNSALNEAAQAVAKKSGVSTKIVAGEIKKQAGRCAPLVQNQGYETR